MGCEVSVLALLGKNWDERSDLPSQFVGKVTKVSDGDTVWVATDSVAAVGSDPVGVGVTDVAKLGVMVGGEPLVTQNKSLLKKYPTAIAAIKGGWYVNTHSGTAAKIGYIKRIAKALKVKVVIGR